MVYYIYHVIYIYIFEYMGSELLLMQLNNFHLIVDELLEL